MVSRATLHHILLDVAGGLLTLHGASIRVLGIVKPEGAATVRVALELLDARLSILSVGELDDSAAARASVWLVLNFGAVDGSDGLEELDEILVAGAPWQLFKGQLAILR